MKKQKVQFSLKRSLILITFLGIFLIVFMSIANYKNFNNYNYLSGKQQNNNVNTDVLTNLNVNTPVSTTTNNSEKNKSDEWFLYTNIRYGLQFAYPGYWTTSGSADTGEYQLLDDVESGGASGGVFIKPLVKQSVDALLVDLQKRAEQSRKYYQEHPDGPATKYSEPELITIAGETAIKQIYQPYEITPAGVMYFFPQKGVEIDLTNLYSSGDDAEKYTNLVHGKVLASLKFLDKLTYLDYGYYTDGKDIYYNHLEFIKNISNKELETFDHFAEKNRNYFDDSSALKVEGVDPGSFVTLHEICGMGGCQGVAKDKHFVYSGGTIDTRLDDRLVDVSTFVYLKYNFFKDKNILYYYGYGWGRVDYVDLDTFEFINPMYSKDKNNVYQFMDGFNIVKGADPKTFKVPVY
ncbi:MAG: hypothetical protein QG642_140 [Patescibacteria group bacterium]|nr:hypothetical protein [Patescibacteria group bacterium]